MNDPSLFWAFQLMRPLQILIWLLLAHIYLVRNGWK